MRPGERGKGYAKEMLRQWLPRCRVLGLTKVLIICGKANQASAHVIVDNGSVLEKRLKLTANAYNGIGSRII